MDFSKNNQILSILALYILQQHLFYGTIDVLRHLNQDIIFNKNIKGKIFLFRIKKKAYLLIVI